MFRQILAVIWLLAVAMVTGCYARQAPEITPVQEVKLTPPANLGFYFLNVANGDRLSGEAHIEVGYTDAKAARFDLTGIGLPMRVDDEENYEATLGYPEEPSFAKTAPDGLKKLAFSIRTDSYANGWHTLQVADKQGRVDVRKVKFYNPIYAIKCTDGFNPNPEPKSPETSKPQTIGMYNEKTGKMEQITVEGAPTPRFAAFTASLVTKKNWKVTVQTQDEKPVVARTFRGNSDKVSVSWDGRNAAGRPLPSDNYDFVLHVAGWKDVTRNTRKN